MTEVLNAALSPEVKAEIKGRFEAVFADPSLMSKQSQDVFMEEMSAEDRLTILKLLRSLTK